MDPRLTRGAGCCRLGGAGALGPAASGCGERTADVDEARPVGARGGEPDGSNVLLIMGRDGGPRTSHSGGG